MGSAQITHPFHPWTGRELAILDRRNVNGAGRVLLEDVDGKRAWVPSSWTDLAPPDPLLLASAGRSSFRAEDMLRLVKLVEDLTRGGGA